MPKGDGIMVFEGLFKKDSNDKKSGDEFIEIDAEKIKENQPVNVRIETLESFADTDKVQEMLRDGSIVFLRIKQLRSNDIGELKRAVDKLRKTCTAMNGDIVGVDEDFLIITPKFARVYRGKPV